MWRATATGIPRMDVAIPLGERGNVALTFLSPPSPCQLLPSQHSITRAPVPQ
jgi:hypothetical protein